MGKCSLSQSRNAQLIRILKRQQLKSMQPLQVLAILLLCGLMGLLGQGVRAVVGLKGVTSSQGIPNQQSEFNAAYLFFSLMIGFLTVILAGLAIGLSSFQTIDLGNLKTLLGVAAAGYAGTDSRQKRRDVDGLRCSGDRDLYPHTTKRGVP
jgi:hypothetical protein